MAVTILWNDGLEAALRAWVGIPTWYTNHDFDRSRFFRFVSVVGQQAGSSLDELDLQERIKKLSAELHPTLNEEVASETAAKYVSLAVNILEYVEATGQ